MLSKQETKKRATAASAYTSKETQRLFEDEPGAWMMRVLARACTTEEEGGHPLDRVKERFPGYLISHEQLAHRLTRLSRHQGPLACTASFPGVH